MHYINTVHKIQNESYSKILIMSNLKTITESGIVTGFQDRLSSNQEKHSTALNVHILIIVTKQLTVLDTIATYTDIPSLSATVSSSFNTFRPQQLLSALKL